MFSFGLKLNFVSCYKLDTISLIHIKKKEIVKLQDDNKYLLVINELF